MRLSIAVVVSLLLLAGCSTDRSPEDFFAPEGVGAIVVDAVLIVDDYLPVIILSRTFSPGEFYDRDAVAVDSALVTVSVDPDGPIVEYENTGLGVFVPRSHPALVVQPNTTYELQVLTAAGEVVHARTTTPERLVVNEWALLDDTGKNVLRTLRTFEELGYAVYDAPENQLVYSEGLLEARFERSPGTVGYQVGIYSLDEDSDYVIDPAFFDDEDFQDLERIVTSPPFAGTDEYVRLPWLAIYFQGRYDIVIYSVDQNWFDLILTLPENNAGIGGNFGDSFARPNFNVEGGIGLFGSASTAGVGFFVHPRP